MRKGEGAVTGRLHDWRDLQGCGTGQSSARKLRAFRRTSSKRVAGAHASCERKESALATIGAAMSQTYWSRRYTLRQAASRASCFLVCGVSSSRERISIASAKSAFWSSESLLFNERRSTRSSVDSASPASSRSNRQMASCLVGPVRSGHSFGATAFACSTTGRKASRASKVDRACEERRS